MPIREDKEIWEIYAKKVKRAALKERRLIKDTDKGKVLTPKKPPPQKNLLKQANPKSLVIPAAVQQKLSSDYLSHKFDRRTERHMKAGNIAIDAQLDMHGMTQKEAHDALQDFVKAQIKSKHRNLLIITGKGSGGKGVLRMNFLKWLDIIYGREMILNVRPAALKHGGEGAFYVVLSFPKDRSL